MDEQLAAWAAQEIRDLDELARSMMPGYDPIGSDDMKKIKALEAIAKGEKPSDDLAELKKHMRELSIQLVDLADAMMETATYNAGRINELADLIDEATRL